MRCMYCGNPKCFVVDSRQVKWTRKRRYTCPQCGRKFSTMERLIKPKEETDEKAL